MQNYDNSFLSATPPHNLSEGWLNNTFRVASSPGALQFQYLLQRMCFTLNPDRVNIAIVDDQRNEIIFIPIPLLDCEYLMMV